MSECFLSLWTLDLLKVEEAMWTVLRKHSFPNFKESLNFLPLWSFEDQSSLIFRDWDQSKNLYTGKVRIIKVYGSWCIIVYYDTMVATIMDKILGTFVPLWPFKHVQNKDLHKIQSTCDPPHIRCWKQICTVFSYLQHCIGWGKNLKV